MKNANLRTFLSRDWGGGERHYECRNGSYSWSKYLLKVVSPLSLNTEIVSNWFYIKNVNWNIIFIVCRINLDILILMWIYCKVTFSFYYRLFWMREQVAIKKINKITNYNFIVILNWYLWLCGLYKFYIFLNEHILL